jgi:RNA polymerase sigma-70 factor (ECF subfamily)
MAFRVDLDDFAAFYELTYQASYRTALAIVREPGAAADAVQDAYIAAYSQRARFRGDAPGSAWLHRIVVNASLQAVRRRRPTVAEIQVEAPGRDADNQSTDRLALFAALEALTPQQRAAVVLRYYHGCDYATIAHALQTSGSNVGVLLNRALARLRVELQPEELASTEMVATR